MPASLQYYRETQHTVRRMIITLAVFCLAVFLILGYLVQRGSAYTVNQCQQRQAGIIRANATWDRMIAVEKKNTFIDNALRYERIQIYIDAKGPVPECGTK